MAELDYAFLAQWAGVQNDGTLTAVGMSFVRVTAPAPGQVFAFCVAGRIRGPHDDDAELEIAIEAPAGQLVRVSGALRLTGEGRYSPGRAHSLFAVNTQVPLVEAGLYTVTVTVGGQVGRVLKFEVGFTDTDAVAVS